MTEKVRWYWPWQLKADLGIDRWLIFVNGTGAKIGEVTVPDESDDSMVEDAITKFFVMLDMTPDSFEWSGLDDNCVATIDVKGIKFMAIIHSYYYRG